MTPRQYAHLLKRHKARLEHEELLTAVIARHVVNFSFNPPTKPNTLADFMPSKWGRKEPRSQVIERLKAQFRSAKQVGAQHARATGNTRGR